MATATSTRAMKSANGTAEPGERRKRREEPKANQEGGRLLSTAQLQLLKGGAGIYFFFIWYGRLQEQIFKYTSPSGAKFTSVWFLQLLDALVNVAVGTLGRFLEGSSPLPQAFLACCGFGQVLSKYCMSASLSVGLSFSVATMAKSAKMVPVMIGSLLLGSKTFSAAQISQAAAIVFGTGIVSFAEGRNKKSGASTKLGIFFILSSLFCDGIVSGLQMRMKEQCRARKTKVRSYDLMFWSNLYMAVASLLFAMLRSEMREGSRFCMQNPILARKILKFAVCGALGQACVFYTIARFDSVVCSAVTSTRKLLSVLISVLEGDGLPLYGWFGVLISSFGIAGEVVSVDQKHHKE